MPIKASLEPTEAELMAGLILLDPLLFRLYFFADELVMAPSLEQKFMFCDISDRVLFCTGRKIAKTIHLEAFVIQQGLIWEKRGITEALFFTPSDVHMIPFLDRVFGRIELMPILKGCARIMRKGDSPLLEWHSGLRWYFRIEGLSGKDTNMVGIRAALVVGDEMAFGNWVCHNSRLQTALPDARWIYAGVPFGNRDSPFYAIDQQLEGKGWSRHKYSTFINPIYHSEEARAKLADDYGGEKSQGYITQVLGEWGEEMISSFPPGSVAVHQGIYFKKEISSIRSDRELDNPALVIGIPTRRCMEYALGWDYGFSPDPSVVFGAYRDSPEDLWHVYFRVVMRRVALPHQTSIVLHLINVVFNGRFIGLSSDRAEAIQELQAKERTRAGLYVWANPAGSTPLSVSPDDPNTSQIYAVLSEEDRKKTVANIPNKELYTGLLKSWMVNATVGLDGRKLWIGNDPEVTDELIMTTERKGPTGRISYYGPPDPNRRTSMLDHNRDALTYLCHAILVGQETQSEAFSEMELIASMGWARAGTERTWNVPWGT